MARKREGRGSRSDLPTAVKTATDLTIVNSIGSFEIVPTILVLHAVS